MITNEAVLSIIQKYEHLALECDGMTRVLHTVLVQEKIPHHVYVGHLTYLPTGETISPHFWITVETCQGNHLLDLRALLWLRKKPKGTVSHGLFQVTQYPHVAYEAQQELAQVPLDMRTFQVLLQQEYGSYVPCGYRTKGARAYLETWMQKARTELVETRFTPFAHKTTALPDHELWCKDGPRGLQTTYKEHYHYFSNQTQKCTIGNLRADRQNWLGNCNYNKDGAPIELVNEEDGIQQLLLFLSRGITIVALCGCPATRYHLDAEDDRYSGCHLKYIANRLEEALPGLPIVQQSVNGRHQAQPASLWQTN